MTPTCVLCAQERNVLRLWLTTPGLNLHGYCAHCGYVSATVTLQVPA